MDREDAAVCGAAVAAAVASGIVDPSENLNFRNVLTVAASVIMPPGSCKPAIPAIQTIVPDLMLRDGLGWYAEALKRTYGDTMDLVTRLKKD
ncbi:heat shock 70 kDa protein 8-like [Trifolium pratense]|uniref:Heat shock 70 kDa protein 8-like n=1 Tax=Trifolium pratense TaxID=57577 RepID=A0A2K3LNL9_TRIPR|nr:heat-shock protein 70T-2 [Trifolium pratense]PNY06563.1 heat shock 70 kDa protein 8-like [Trifolium pratense]